MSAYPTFLIWSFRHKAWWRAQGQGYTTKQAEAGRFTFEEAMVQNLDPISTGNRPAGDALIKETR
ncbi:MAG TPA: hypothetical protein DHV93_05955 [Holophagaceae bacterium]|nr:hypothetical protein [Holophagaceae bacterium]